MTAWIYTDDRGAILATNARGMAGNTGWQAYDGAVPDDLIDSRGVARYKLVDGTIQPRAEREMEADRALPAPGVSDTDAALVELAALLAQTAQRLDEQDAALVELAAIVAGGGA